jgi:hypothetical protein
MLARAVPEPLAARAERRAAAAQQAVKQQVALAAQQVVVQQAAVRPAVVRPAVVLQGEAPEVPRSNAISIASLRRAAR